MSPGETDSDAVILTDEGGLVRFWNNAAARLFGWSASERLGRPLRECFPASSPAERGDYLARLAGAADWDGTVEALRRDGRPLRSRVRVQAMRDEGGALLGALSLFRPDEAVGTTGIAGELYAAELLDCMPAHLAVLGPEGHILQVNRAWREFALENTPGGGAPGSTGVGANYLHLCRSCSGERCEEALSVADGIEDVLRGRRGSFQLEYSCDSPEEPRWFLMQALPLAHPGAGAVVAHHNITARKKAELKVATQNHLLELALSAARLGVWSLDVRTGRIECSEEASRILGSNERIGDLEAWSRMIHPEDLETTKSTLRRSLEGGLPFFAEFRVIFPDDQVRWLASLARVEHGADGEVLAAVGTVEDISERKRTERTLLSYNRILEFIATGADLQRTLEEVVHLVEEFLPRSLCSVLVVDPSGRRLRFGAGPSLPGAYNRAVDGVPVGPKEGSCGTAAYRRQTVVVEDIEADPLWDDYRALATQHGLRSCISVPIFAGGNAPGTTRGAVLGTFALYSRQPGPVLSPALSILSEAGLLAREVLEKIDSRATDLAGLQSARVAEAAHLAGVAIERELAEQAVHESEERFRSVLDSLPAAIYLKDTEGKYLFVNKATSTVLGVAGSDWIGKRARDLLPGGVTDLLERNEARARESGGRVDERLTFRQPSGREVVVLSTYFPLFHRDHGIHSICGILTEITELVSAQRQFFQLWTHSPEPLCVVRPDGYFDRLNPAWTRLLGCSEGDLLARPLLEWVHHDDQTAAESAFQRLAAGELSQRFEVRFRAADGSYRWFSWTVLRPPEERSVYGFIRDVTEERLLGDQFRHSQKMEVIGQLASGVAHDFNNLLTVIIAECDYLLGEMGPDDPKTEPLSEVLAAGQRAAELTAQLLAVSRKAFVEPRVLDPNFVVTSSIKMLRRLIGEDVSLETVLNLVPSIRIDPGQLQQVFMNLTVNARDAMPDGGCLRIGTSSLVLGADASPELAELEPGLYAELTFSDTGTGILPEVKAHLFEPFFTTKGVGKGTGLGLATVYGIIRQARGMIWVESQVGLGSVFHILLPGETELALPFQPVSTPLPRGTETILLVEDDAGVRRVACAILAAQGYPVLTAADGGEAIRIARDHEGPLDLLLTDVVMPELGGRALADRIRGLRAGLRVLYMSGYTDDAVLRSGVETSRDLLIQKPFSPRTLALRVRETLDRSP